MNIFDKINLPSASKYLVSLLLKKGGILESISGTNGYIVRFRKREYIFIGEFTPLIPYMYGISLSNQRYWFEILKELKVKFDWYPNKKHKRVTILMTRDGLYNAILEKSVEIIGNGTSDLKTLIKTENLRRINSKEKSLMPVTIKNGSVRLNQIPKTGEKIQLSENYDYEDITKLIDKKLVKIAKNITDSLPRLPFLRFEIYVDKFEKVNKFTLRRVLISPGDNIFFKVTNGKKWHDTGKTLLSLMIR